MTKSEEIADNLTQNHFLLAVDGNGLYLAITTWHYSRRNKNSIIFYNANGDKLTMAIENLSKHNFIKLL